MAHISEYEVEDIFIGRLESIGYKFIKLDNYDDVLANFREQLAKFNAKKLTEKGHDASFSDAEFNRIMIHVDNHSVYESAKILRDKYVLQLDNGESEAKINSALFFMPDCSNIVRNFSFSLSLRQR